MESRDAKFLSGILVWLTIQYEDKNNSESMVLIAKIAKRIDAMHKLGVWEDLH